jgi:hypothetical protein
MIQEILTYTIVILAVATAIRRFYIATRSGTRKLRHGSNRKAGACAGCTSECVKNLPAAKNPPLSGDKHPCALH